MFTVFVEFPSTKPSDEAAAADFPPGLDALNFDAMRNRKRDFDFGASTCENEKKSGLLFYKY